MKIRFIDADIDARKYNVGDYFDVDGVYICEETIDGEFQNLDFDIRPDDRSIRVYNRVNKCRYGWSFDCQEIFLIVDLDSNKVLFTSKDYSRDQRCEPDCSFYNELRLAVDRRFEIESKFQLISEVEFMDI